MKCKLSTNRGYIEKKTLKYLNSPQYNYVLWIIGRSKTPLSRYKVMKELNGNTYTYDIIDNLAARLYETEFLFNITELFSQEDINTKKIIILKKINRILDLQIDFLKNSNDDLLTTKDIQIIIYNQEETNDGKKGLSFILFGTSRNYLRCILLYIPSIDQFENKLYIDETLTVSNVYIEKENIQLQKEKKYIKEFEVRLSLNKKRQILVYLLKNRSNITINYLDLTYDDKTNNLINKKKEEYPNLTIGGIREITPEIERAVKDPKNWRFLLNFRGVLLFLAGFSNSKDKKTYKRIKEVISNERIKKLAPFLQYWDDFEKEGFPVIKLLIKIADELKDQLHYESTDLSSNNNSYLLKRATERYFVAWLNYFYHRGISMRKLNETSNESDSVKIFLEYKQSILNFLKVSHENDIKTIERL